MPVQISIHPNLLQVYVQVPHYPPFINAVMAVGAQPILSTEPGHRGFVVWAAPGEQRVRELCRHFFGTDGTDGVTLVTVRVDATKLPKVQTWYLFGRMLAHRPSRNKPTELGAGVRLTAGGFLPHGGSAAYPKVAPGLSCVLEVQDVPRSLAEREAAEMPGIVELVEPAPVSSGRGALKDMLLGVIAEYGAEATILALAGALAELGPEWRHDDGAATGIEAVTGYSPHRADDWKDVAAGILKNRQRQP